MSTVMMKFTEDNSMGDSDRKRLEIYVNAESQEANKKDSDLLELFDFLGIKKKYFQETFNIKTASSRVSQQIQPRIFWLHDEQHHIVFANNHFLNQYGNCKGKTCYKQLMGEDEVCGCCQSPKALRSNAPQHCDLCSRKKAGYDINTFHLPIKNIYGDRFILQSSFHIDYSATVCEGVHSREQGKRTSFDILISCSACKRIKDGEENWVRADSKILDLYSGRISHGICPECINLLYPHLLDLPDYTDKKANDE